jgi:polyhydroxyalkanoate synthesis regulator phasin
MIDLIKKSLLAGVGVAMVTKEKVEESLNEFVRDGKLSAQDARVMAEKIAEQGKREFDELSAKLGAKLKDFTARGEEETRAKLVALEQRLRVLEERLSSPPTRSGEP